MKFAAPLTEGTLLRRYKRFFADVELDDGRVVTAHVAATGTMAGCSDPGSRAALSFHPGTGRKLEWSLELVRAGDTWVCVNTALPNRVAEEAISSGRIEALSGYPSIRREVAYGAGSRIDLLLSDGDRRCYVEVKCVTMKEGARALFPDAVTTRGTKHLLELAAMAGEGHRAVMLFLVVRGDCASMGPARQVDPEYARVLEEVAGRGVELLAYQAAVSPEGIEVVRQMPVVF